MRAWGDTQNLGGRGLRRHESLNAHLCVELNEDVPPVAIEGGDSYSEIRFLLLEWLAI